MRHYDDGGVVAPDPNAWTDDKQSQLQDWLAKNMGPAPAGSSTSPAFAPKVLGAPSTPPAAGSPPPSPSDMATSGESSSQGSTEPAAKTVDSHPGLSPEQNDKLLQYVQGQQQQVDKFGPDQQKAVMDSIAQQQNGIPNKIGRALSGWADATATGVGRSANPGFAERYDARENATANRQMDLGKRLNEQQQTGLKEKQALAGMSSGTPLGTSEAKAAQFLAKQLWPKITPQQLAAIGQNPQALKGILPEGVDLQKGLAEIANMQAFREATLGIQKGTLENTKQHEREEENLAEQQKQQEAAKTLAARGDIKRLFDWVTGNPAVKILEAQAAGQQGKTFATEKEAESANLPPGTEVTIGGRRARVR